MNLVGDWCSGFGVQGAGLEGDHLAVVGMLDQVVVGSCRF